MQTLWLCNGSCVTQGLEIIIGYVWLHNEDITVALTEKYLGINGTLFFFSLVVDGPQFRLQTP